MKRHNDYDIVVLYAGTREACSSLEFKYRPISNIGMNHQVGGGSDFAVTEVHFPLSVKEKISIGLKRAYENNPKYRKSVQMRNVGKVASAETKEKLSRAKKGRGEAWRNSIASDIWKDSDKHYESYKEVVHRCKDNYHKFSVKLFCALSGISFNQHAAIYRKFKTGWNPNEDEDWLQTFKTGWNPNEDEDWLQTFKKVEK